MLSMNVANGLVASFMSFYLQRQLGIEVQLAGIIASLVVVVPIFSALLGGKMYDRLKKPRLQMMISCVGMAMSLLATAIQNVGAALLGSAVCGVFTGTGFTVGFATARDLYYGESGYETFAVAWVNCISLVGLFVPPLLFSFVATHYTYSAAWLMGAALTLLLAVPLVKLEEKTQN
jgi:MFS family permease